MIKKIFALLAVLLLTVGAAASAESIPGDAYFQRGKDALVLLAQGDSEAALEKLDFSYADPQDSDEAFVQFVSDYLPGLNEASVQQDVSVCYYENLSQQWLLAIPVSEPVSDDIMALVLMSGDLDTFSDYAALSWAEVNEGTALSDWVWWNVEYDAGGAALYAD